MKNQTTTPPLYLWSQAKDAADKLATWAYTTLIKPESPHAKTYPLHGASSTLLQDGSWGLVLTQPEEPSQTKETSESISFSQQPKEFLEPSRVRQHLEEIANALQKTSDFSKSYYSSGFISGDLSKAVNKANKLLSELAATNKWSAEHFWFSTLEAVIELENLSARADAFPALQAVARKQTMWPVVYPQNKAAQLALKKEMERLGLGTQSIFKVGSTSRHSTSGKYARRIVWMLWEVHFDGNLRQCLCRLAVAPLTSKGEIALDATLYKEEAAKGLLERTPDAESPQKWEARLVAQGWPQWIVKLHQLPELAADNADDWFEVGWEALQAATGEKVLDIPELAELGKSNAAYGNRIGLKSGGQNSRAEDQIKKLLRKAFLARFGNPF